jgi:hypothetical protein
MNGPEGRLVRKMASLVLPVETEQKNWKMKKGLANPVTLNKLKV